MFFRTTELAELLPQGLESDRYRFSYRTDLARLVTSIRRDGLLTPLVLQERENGIFRIVSGFRRVQALKQIGAQRADAFVLPPGRDSEEECLRRSLQENHWHRGFNEVEKALLFTRLHDEFPACLPGLDDLLTGELRLPRGPRSLEPYRFLLSLPEAVLDGLADGRISLGQAQLLRLFPPDRRVRFCGLMTACELTLQESRQVAEWILDCFGGENSSEGTDEGCEVWQCLPAEGLSPRQRAQRLLSTLRHRRYPELESWKQRFAAACLQAGIGGEGIRVAHDPAFESTEVRVEIRARSETELSDRIDQLSRASTRGRLKPLFEALRVE